MRTNGVTTYNGSYTNLYRVTNWLASWNNCEAHVQCEAKESSPAGACSRRTAFFLIHVAAAVLRLPRIDNRSGEWVVRKKQRRALIYKALRCFLRLKTRLVFGNWIMKIRCFFASSGICQQRSFNHGAGVAETCDNQEHCHCPESAFSFWW